MSDYTMYHSILWYSEENNMISTHGYSFDDSAIRRIVELQRQIDRTLSPSLLYTARQAQQIYNQISMDGITLSLKTCNAILKSYDSSSISGGLAAAQQFATQISPITHQILQEQSWLQSIAQGLNSPFQALVESYNAVQLKPAEIENLVNGLRNLSKLDVSEIRIADEYPSLSNDEEEQLSQDLAEAINDRKNWQQRFMAVIDVWRKKNPVIACILGAIILELIIQIFFTTFSFTVQVVASAIVRAEPNTSSLKIARVQEAQNVLGIGEVPYYYQIEFDDPDTQEHLRGYISKRSVKLVLDPVDNEDSQPIGPTKLEKVVRKYYVS